MENKPMEYIELLGKFQKLFLLKNLILKISNK